MNILLPFSSILISNYHIQNLITCDHIIIHVHICSYIKINYHHFCTSFNTTVHLCCKHQFITVAYNFIPKILPRNKTLSLNSRTPTSPPFSQPPSRLQEDPLDELLPDEREGGDEEANDIEEEGALKVGDGEGGRTRRP